MKELTFKNHFTFGYGQEAFTFRTSGHQKWFASYGKCTMQIGRFDFHCLEASRLIRSSTQKEIYILFSGGIDSEVVLRSFIGANIKVNVAILRFKNDLNVHDISWAIIICNALGIDYEIFELDLIQFWNVSAFEYALQTHCISPRLISTMYLCDQIIQKNGFPVLGSGECLLKKRIEPNYVPGISAYSQSDWELWESEKIAAWYRFFIITNAEGCPGFFQYTPEIMLSYLNDPIVKDLVGNRIVGKLSTASSKLSIYNNYFPLAKRPKYDGFEKVPQSEELPLRNKLQIQFPFHNETHKTNYLDLVHGLQYGFTK